MPDNTTVITDKQEKSIGQEVREKSFQQIFLESQQQQNNPDKQTEPTDEEKQAAEEKAAKEAEEAVKQAEEAKKAEAERQALLAKQAAEEVVKKQQEEKQAEQDKLKAEELARKREESLKPIWRTDPNAPKDENGNPVPRSYDELAAEAKRIAKEEIMAEIDARDRARLAELEKQQKAVEQQQEQQKQTTQYYENKIKSGVDNLYRDNKMPKIARENDESDPGWKEYVRLFKTAQDVNLERMKKGDAAIDDIELIYYKYFKPAENPAGHDAPVMGNESSISKEAPEDRYVVSRDRNKPMSQLVKEEAMRLSKKLGIRSK